MIRFHTTLSFDYNDYLLFAGSYTAIAWVDA
jgi:hypothetical protein